MPVPPDGVDRVDRYRLDVQRTYRYLRLAIVLLVGLLGTGVLIQVVRSGELLGSISAYYHTPARSVFVSCLCAIGTCLVVHRGRSDLEDVLLNTSGLLAFVVAFVPTGDGAVVDAAARAVSAQAIDNNAWALLVATVVAFVVVRWVVPQDERMLRSRSSRVVQVLAVLTFVAFCLFYVLRRPDFVSYAHYVAAVVLFAGVVGVVLVNAVARSRVDQPDDAPLRWSGVLRNRYGLGFLAMLASIVVVVLLGPVLGATDSWVFWLEAALIAQFAVFWVLQSQERWSDPDVVTDDRYPG